MSGCAPELRWLALGLALLAFPAQAQQVQRCGPRADLLRELAARYHEAPVALGIRDDDASVLEILATDDGATWTAIVTRSNGVSCVVMSGANWQGKVQGRGA